MIQEAIVLTEDNMPMVAGELADCTVEDLYQEVGHLLNRGFTIVLVRTVFEDGLAIFSHAVTASMFYANATATDLNETTFVKVFQL